MRRAMVCRLLAVLLPFTAAAVAAAPARDETYTNERYGFSLRYPADQLTAQPESDSGDGRRFTAGNDVAVAAFAYGRLDERAAERVAAEAQEDCAGTAPTYRVDRRSLVALSCVHAGTVFYQKTILRAETETTLQAHYPANKKAHWDSVIAAMAKSLRDARP